MEHRARKTPPDTGQMMEDYHGRWVPKELVKPIDLARDQVVRDLVAQAQQLSAALAAFRAKALGEIAAFVSLSAEQYGISWGGDKGNVGLLSYDGRLKVQRHIAERLVFDERLQVAKRLVDACVREWSEDSNANVRALIEHAFQVDKAGKVNTQRVLGLRKLDIQDPKWHEAMRAIGDSIQVSDSATYLRFYARAGDRWEPIPLDIVHVADESPVTP